MKSQIIMNLAYSAAGIKDNTDNLRTATWAIIWTSYFNQIVLFNEKNPENITLAIQ